MLSKPRPPDGQPDANQGRELGSHPSSPLRSCRPAVLLNCGYRGYCWVERTVSAEDWAWDLTSSAVLLPSWATVSLASVAVSLML